MTPDLDFVDLLFADVLVVVASEVLMILLTE